MSDLSAYLAGELVDWMSQNDQVATPPTDLYVTLFDDVGNEVDGSLSDARKAVSTTNGWTRTNTAFENAGVVSLGEATADISNIQDVALYDSASFGEELARYAITDAPFDISEGTEFRFEAGDLSFDVIDNTQ